MMAGRPAHRETDDDAGAPEWMVTFSDCMTLLLTFFVLLISFSSFDEKVFRRMESALADGLSSIGVLPIREREAFKPTPQIVYDRELRQGSEKPTVRGRYESNPSESLDLLDFEDQKVFLVPSDKVFWGRGTRLSQDGRQLFADVATLMKAIPNRIVVSEHALDENGDDAIGLERAWTVIDLLAREHGLDKARLSISSASTVERRSHPFLSGQRGDRVLEIVVLERSVYR